MCGAPDQDTLPALEVSAREAVVHGFVTREGSPLAGAYVRLLAPAHLPQEQAQRAGHIPTAGNVPWSKAANDDGTFKSDDALDHRLGGDVHAVQRQAADRGTAHVRRCPARRRPRPERPPASRTRSTIRRSS